MRRFVVVSGCFRFQTCRYIHHRNLKNEGPQKIYLLSSMAIFDVEIYVKFQGGIPDVRMDLTLFEFASPSQHFSLARFWTAGIRVEPPTKITCEVEMGSHESMRKAKSIKSNGCGCTSGFLRIHQHWFQMFRNDWNIILPSSQNKHKPKPGATLPRANFEAVPESPSGLVSANISAYKLAIKGHVCDLSFDAVVLNCNCLILQISVI